MCLSGLCVQLLEKVSPNPREVKSVAAKSNPTKNRSMEYLPGIMDVAVLKFCRCHYHYFTQWTDGGWY